MIRKFSVTTLCCGSVDVKRRPLLIQSLQELSYRKQIARQLRTQFVEGIYVTLKIEIYVKGYSRSLETEPLDRSYRLTVRRVIGR